MPFRRMGLCLLAFLAGGLTEAHGCLLCGGLGMSCNQSGGASYGASYGGAAYGAAYGSYGVSSAMPYQYQSVPLMSAPLTTVPAYSTVATTAVAPLATYSYSAVPLTLSAAPVAAAAASPTLTVPMTIGTQAVAGAANRSARLVIAGFDDDQNGGGNGGADCASYQSQSVGVVSAIRDAIELIKVIKDVLGDGAAPPPPAADFESRLRAVEDDVAELKRRVLSPDRSEDRFREDRFGEDRFGEDRGRDRGEDGGESYFPESRQSPAGERSGNRSGHPDQAAALRQMMETMQKLSVVPDQLSRLSGEIESLQSDIDRLTKRIEKLEAAEAEAPGH